MGWQDGFYTDILQIRNVERVIILNREFAVKCLRKEHLHVK